MWVTGLVNRSISSTALGSSDGSTRSSANWSGWSSSAKVPSAMRLRVVSLPATRSRNEKLSRSASLSLLAVDLRRGKDAQQVVLPGDLVRCAAPRSAS